MRLARLTLLVLATLLLPATPPATAATAVAVDRALTETLHQALDTRRRHGSRHALFARGAYHADAETLARAALSGSVGTSGRDRSPAAVRVVRVADLGGYSVTWAINQVAYQLDSSLASAHLTDAGWAVVTSGAEGAWTVAVAAVVGWPAPTLPANARCTGWGYCWNARGPNPHLPWTRNRLTWYLSTANLTPAAEEIVRAALYRVNVVSGLGVDLAYGGRSAQTDVTDARPFLVVFANACVAAGAIGCAEVNAVGPYQYVHGARVIVQVGQYRAAPAARELWIGTVAHEIAHSLGLSHFDAAYAGRYQLMRSSGGPDTVQAGDANGLRAVAPPGYPAGRLALTSALVPRGGTARATVTAWSSGLGGVRQVRVDCLDATWRWRPVAQVSGAFDITARGHLLSWRADRSTYCRPVVRGKARNWTGPATLLRAV